MAGARLSLLVAALAVLASVASAQTVVKPPRISPAAKFGTISTSGSRSYTLKVIGTGGTLKDGLAPFNISYVTPSPAYTVRHGKKVAVTTAEGVPTPEAAAVGAQGISGYNGFPYNATKSADGNSIVVTLLDGWTYPTWPLSLGFSWIFWPIGYEVRDVRGLPAVGVLLIRIFP